MPTPLQELIETFEKLEKDEVQLNATGARMLAESLLYKEERTIKDAIRHSLDEDGHTGDWKIKFAEDYYDKLSK